MKIIRIKFATICLALFLLAAAAQAQTTAFSYQGHLNEGGTAANGTYEMQFQLFDSVKGGNQIGKAFTDSNVVVANGVFTTTLDFGECFDGSPRYLEVGVRPAKNPDPFTVLGPRQAINYVPYAVRSMAATASDGLSKACVDCVTNSQVQNLDGAKITGEIPPESVPSGSVNYIQNSVASLRAGRPRVVQEGSFDITGDGSIGGSLSVNQTFTLAGESPPAIAPAGSGRIYFDAASNKVKVSENNGAFVNLVGATGVSGSGTTNSIPLWSAGTTLGSSLISQSGAVVQLPNNVTLAAGAQGNNVAFGSPNSETGMTISGPTGRADVRFDGTTLRLFAGPAGSPPSNGVAINSSAVQLPNNVSLATGAQGNAVSFGSPNSETGMSISGASGRADIRYDGTLKLLNGPGGIPSNGIAINTSGNVGIGTTTPAHRLSLIGGPAWTSNGWTGAVELGNGSAIGWQANAAGSRSGIGQSNGGLYFFGTASNPGTTGSPAIYDMVINDNGNITQPITSNGLVKAMLYVQQDGTILQCYNGIGNSTTGQCGFTLDHPILEGSYFIHFPFQVDNRFVSVTARNPDNTQNGTFVAASFRFDSANGTPSSTSVRVITFITSTSHISGDPANFMLVIY